MDDVANLGKILRTLILGAGVLILFLGGQTLARFAVFGDPLPNTYYLKMTGYPAVFRILRGGLAFLRFAGTSNVALIVLPFAALLIRRDRARVFLCWLVAAQWAYSVYVGGDSWESWGGANRFVSTTSSGGSLRTFAGADFRFGTTLNMLPPWKSAWRGVKFSVSSELAPGRGYHVLHWVGDGPGYMDLHCLCEGHDCCSVPLPLPLPPLPPLPLPLPSPFNMAGPPEATRARRTGQFRPMWPTSPHS